MSQNCASQIFKRRKLTETRASVGREFWMRNSNMSEKLMWHCGSGAVPAMPHDQLKLPRHEGQWALRELAVKLITAFSIATGQGIKTTSRRKRLRLSNRATSERVLKVR